MRKRKEPKVKYFSFVQRYFAGLVILLIISLTVVSSTLAYYFDSDWASNVVEMSGKVNIEVVSKSPNYKSIEDDEEGKLIIYFEDDYSVHIPGAWIEPTANVKIFKSTTKPLLRAIMNVYLIDMETKEEISDEDIDTFDLTASLYNSMSTIVKYNGWVYYPEDKYYYYIKDNTVEENVEETFLHEVEVEDEDDEFIIIDFINSPIQFPEEIDSTYSGYGVKFVITFEAIQDYVPDKFGKKLPNTIENAKVIFDNPTSNPYEEE